MTKSQCNSPLVSSVSNPEFKLGKLLSVRILKHPVKSTNGLCPAWQNIAGYHHIHGQKKISYLEPGGTLEKIKQPKTLIWRHWRT